MRYLILLNAISCLVGCGQDFEIDSPLSTGIYPFIGDRNQESTTLGTLKFVDPNLPEPIPAVPSAIKKLIWEDRKELITSILDLSHGDEAVLEGYLTELKVLEAQEIYYTISVLAGYAILGGEDITDTQMRITRKIVLAITAKHPQLRSELLPRTGFYLVVIPPKQGIDVVPEWFRWEKQFTKFVPAGICGRACGGTIHFVGSETIEPTWGVFIHELGHGLMSAISRVDPNFEKQIQRAYDNAIEAGKWEGLYAGVNVSEYFAEGVRLWYLPHTFQSRAELWEYDAGLCRVAQ